MRKPLISTVFATLLAFGAPSLAGAIEAGDKIWIHGYGNWSFELTDGNAYMNGTNDGNYERLEFSLSMAAEPAPRTAIHAQIFIEKDKTSEEGATTSVDFAFAEYAFDPALSFRIGAVKQPFGIFTETFDVGTLYPFPHLAQGLYGPSGFIAESYLGAGLTGRLDVGSGWQLQYDLYGGEMDTALSTPWAAEGEAEAAEGEAEAAEGETDIKGMVGGRLNLNFPGESGHCGLSAYSGENTASPGEASDDHRHSAYGAHLEYFVGPVTLRAEYAGQQTGEYTGNAAYAEASWKLSTNWLVAARYDWAKTTLDEDNGIDDNLLKHQDIGLAVNYFFSPNFVLKLAWHQVTGNRFTSADDEDAEQDEKTSLVTFGTSFSF